MPRQVHEFSEDALRQMVRRFSPAEVLSFTRVPTGHFNTTLGVETASGPLILRISPPDDAGFVFYERRMMAQEPGLHRLLLERTSAPVPEILGYDDSRSLIDRDYLLMRKLPGRPLSDCGPRAASLENTAFYQVGRYLREIHEITADCYGYLGEHHPMEPQRSWASAFRVMWDMMIDDVASAGYYDSSEAAHMRGLLSRHHALFDRPVTSRLLHMDIWHQNILVDETGSVTGLVDFDRALWGDREIEFAVLDYCGVSIPAFWEGYGKQRDESPAAVVRQVFYLLYELQKYIPIYAWRNKEPGTALRYKRQVESLASRLA
jgi:aminoglycoside phosphotransferase (APT) family kinase protein